MSAPFKLKAGYMTRPQLLKAYAKGNSGKVKKLIDELREKNAGLCEILVQKADGNHNYAYSPKFVSLLKDALSTIPAPQKKEKGTRPGFLTAKEFARKFRTNSKVIKETIEKYGIDKGTYLIDKTTEDWLIPEFLHTELAKYLLPDADMMPTGRVLRGGRKPGLDHYDGNFS